MSHPPCNPKWLELLYSNSFLVWQGRWFHLCRKDSSLKATKTSSQCFMQMCKECKIKLLLFGRWITAFCDLGSQQINNSGSSYSALMKTKQAKLYRSNHLRQTYHFSIIYLYIRRKTDNKTIVCFPVLSVSHWQRKKLEGLPRGYFQMF